MYNSSSLLWAATFLSVSFLGMFFGTHPCGSLGQAVAYYDILPKMIVFSVSHRQQVVGLPQLPVPWGCQRVHVRASQLADADKQTSLARNSCISMITRTMKLVAYSSSPIQIYPILWFCRIPFPCALSLFSILKSHTVRDLRGYVSSAFFDY